MSKQVIVSEPFVCFKVRASNAIDGSDLVEAGELADIIAEASRFLSFIQGLGYAKVRIEVAGLEIFTN